MSNLQPRTSGDTPSARIDASIPHPARRYDYWLGGKDNFAADRESADRITAAFPSARTGALENRRFMHRAVRYLAEQAGIRQFLDVGSGIPTSPNTYEIAQSVAPASRVVYVDNDPIVLAHARALLASVPEGATAYLDADLRQPQGILNDPDLTHTLDLSQPVALMLVAVLHFIPDADNPRGLIDELLAPLASGSYLMISHVTPDLLAPETATQANRVATKGAVHGRSRAQITAFFDGLDLVEPGIVPVSEWRAETEPGPRPTPAEVGSFGAVARLP